LSYANTATKLPEQMFRVSPVILNVPLSPGKSFSYTVTVENLTTQPLPLQASLNDFETTGEEGGYVFTESKKNPLLSWIMLDEPDILLSPKEKKELTLTITTPSSIPVGGYNGMLFLEPVLSNANTSVTHVRSKIGVLLLANIGVPDPTAKKAEILTFSPGLFHQQNEFPLLLRVKNISLHHFTAKPILTITPLLPIAKKEFAPIYLEEKIIFQNKIRRWEQNMTVKDLTPNVYKATMSVSTGNGQFVTMEKYLVVFPFTDAALIGIVIIITFFLLIKRKRLKKAISAFFSR
jgi:hypothetical protein